MADRLRLFYLFDPLCGWCYGASAIVRRLAALPGVELVPSPTGLFSGDGARPMDEAFAAYAWANDQRIERLTGQPFTEDYRHRVLGDRSRPFDSGPATLTLAAVAVTEPGRELEALAAIQAVRYVEGRDITDAAVLCDMLHACGLVEAARRLAAPDAPLHAADEARRTAASGLMHRFGLTGVPALVAGEGAGARPVGANRLFGDFDLLVRTIRPT
ncbi:DsbA family protein [Azospirillum thermophilum]|uniref:Protein-disulfide isomerase n=1 Tax=Azospirillum thermophilum TaxID=2202148 RepID=A0A2S2CX38_9PROT|nr:protein-disulfide isomerase [Azospirillum thermophilum]AWK89018.1 protein-disulfide isomerase [Azospirillum thermophilum]